MKHTIIQKKILCVYISDRDVWDKTGYCSDYTNSPEAEMLGKLGLTEEMDGVFSLLTEEYENGEFVPTDILTQEQIHDKLVEAGFVYDADFEEFMRDFEEER